MTANVKKRTSARQWICLQPYAPASSADPGIRPEGRDHEGGRGSRRAGARRQHLVVLVIGVASVGFASAQPPSVRQLDQEAERARSEYLTRLDKLATGYENAGQTGKAKEVLRQILEMNPQAEGTQERLGKLENLVFENQSVTVEVDAARGWTSTGLFVEKGKPVRVEAAGTYKFIANLTLGPDGVATADVSRDAVAGIEFGKLMGLVVAPPKPTKRESQPRPGAPFAIGTKSEFTPETAGLLLLRLNIPAGTKSNGKLKVTISGNIRTTSAP